MSREHESLSRLSQIADLKRDAESLSLVAINQRIARLQGQVARIRRSVALRSRGLELDSSRMSGADVLWARRSDQQIGALQSEIASLLVERETVLKEAKLANSKSLAVAALLDRAMKERRSRGAGTP